MNDRDEVTSVCVVLGVPVDDVTVASAVDRIAELVSRGRSTGAVHQVSTVNVDFVVNATADPEVRRILQRTDLAIPDGMPIVWASRLLGAALRERATGIDLLPAVARRCAAESHRMLLFGGATGVASRAAAVLRDAAPRLDVVVVDAPQVRPDGAMDGRAAVVAAIRRLDADVVCVALGNPKQERWIDRHATEVGAPVYIGVGGSLDFLTGVTRRAPHWMQRAGLEWLHRAISEPRRLAGRYAHDLRVFAPAVAKQAWVGRRRGRAIAPTVAADAAPTRMKVVGPIPQSSPEPVIVDLLHNGGSLLLDLSDAGRLDNTSVCALTSLVRLGHRHGATVHVLDNTTSQRWRTALGGLDHPHSLEYRAQRSSTAGSVAVRGGESRS